MIQRKPLPAGATVHVQSELSRSQNGPVYSIDMTPEYEKASHNPVISRRNGRIFAGGLSERGYEVPSGSYGPEGTSQQILHHELSSQQSGVADVSNKATQLPTMIPAAPSSLRDFPLAESGAHPIVDKAHRATDSFFEEPHLLRQTSPDEMPTTEDTSQTSGSKTKVANALQEASFFLGGLIKHPTESNKHFTILRHSHGLVYYKGPTTSIAITVFSDKPLPVDRRYWLQMKGWTGKPGMRAKALIRTNGSWINVTPDRRARAEELVPTDERAWQRDIKKFQDKAPKHLKKHIIRETAVLRVPFEAVDGYFRAVLTQGDSRYPLCPSPVFRVASTSMSAGSVKGASLSTLPLELSVNILQFAAKQMAVNAASPIASAAKQQVTGLLPSAVQSYGQTAYNVSGVQGQIDSLNTQYDERREQTLNRTKSESEHYMPISRPDVSGNVHGPESPFPLQINSKIVRGTGQSHRQVGMPTANIDDISPDKIASMSGVYFGWAIVTPKDPAQLDLHSDWRYAIISVSHHLCEKAVPATKKSIRVYLIHDYSGQDFVGSKISLTIMGYLRPMIPLEDKEAYFYETVRDVEITRNSLSREKWGPEQTLKRIQTARSDRSFTDRYVDTRMACQRRLDNIPIHKLGVRNDSSGMNDKALYGNGGLYVVRDAR